VVRVTGCIRYWITGFVLVWALVLVGGAVQQQQQQLLLLLVLVLVLVLVVVVFPR
jgi:hypothetical protein